MFPAIQDRLMTNQAVSLLYELNFRIALLERSSLAAVTTTLVPQPSTTSKASINNLRRLALLYMSTFSEGLHKWLSFWDQFEGLIHKNSEVTANDKFP